MLRTPLSRFVSDYGMAFVLILICGYYSLVTWDEQHPNGVEGAEELAEKVQQELEGSPRLLIVARSSAEDLDFTKTLEMRLAQAELKPVATVNGQPLDARRALQSIVESGAGLDAIVTNRITSTWAVFDGLEDQFPSLTGLKIMTPSPYSWPNFLKSENLLNVANQIVVIALIAVGMTLVIISAGIDLSVGSLIALSAVISTLLIREVAGAEEASDWAMFCCCMVGVAACGLAGTISGLMVTLFSIPPFIVTLSMMLVASGLAYILAQGQSVYEVPDSFVWLGRGAELGVPNAVILMAVLYATAHVMMTRTTLGRYIYAVGGNPEVARLSGVRVRGVLIFVYGLCGALAGLGGVVMASQLKSGSPTYGQMYELYVIAAVVVGGASLSGGQGKILGTLIGAFIIAVIQNGMNLTGVESYTQKVVLGLIILSAVLLDMTKKRGWAIWQGRGSSHV